MTTMTTGSSLEHPIGPDGIVKIRLRHGEIRLRAVDGERVRVRDRHGHDLAGLFSIDLGEGSIDLSSGDEGGHEGGRRRSGHAPDIDVELPRRATIVVQTTSAEIDGEGLLGDQRYKSTSGEVTLHAVSGTIAIDAVSGDLDIVAVDEIDLSIRTVSGDVGVRAATIRSLQAGTTSGDLKVAGRLAGPGPFAIETVSGDALLAPAGELRIDMTTMSGDLRSELGERADVGRGRRSIAIGTTGPTLTFRSMSGDLKVVRPMAVPLPSTQRPMPAAPIGQATPIPPDPPAPPAPLANGAIAAAYEDARLRILRSLEDGEIDVAEAGRRLEALDAADPVDPTTATTRSPVVDPADA
jgi:hypothetical protein